VRPFKRTKAAFLRAYKKATTTKELAELLDISTPCAYSYMRRWNVPPPRTQNLDRKQPEVYALFSGQTSLNDICEECQVSRSTARNMIGREAKAQKDVFKNSNLPIPKNTQQIKVAKELMEDDSLFDKPEELSERTAVQLTIVNDYLQQVFKYNSR